MRLNQHFLKNALPGITLVTEYFPENSPFSIDTRTLQPGDIFIALEGLNCDGHDFIGRADYSPANPDADPRTRHGLPTNSPGSQGRGAMRGW